MYTNLIKAIDSAQRAQRNYDLSKTISKEDFDMLVYAAAHSPSKQNETHYSLHVYNDKDTIRQIYNHTKKFTLIKDSADTEDLFGVDDKGNYWQDDTQSVTNSQVLANALFVFVEEEGELRGGTHIAGKENPYSVARDRYRENVSYSIGISVGQLILIANLLGYKTGICSAMDSRPIKKIIGTENSVKLLVGVGYETIGSDRRLHGETLNRDVPEKHRTGDLDERWRFPSFNKKTKVYINGSKNS